MEAILPYIPIIALGFTLLLWIGALTKYMFRQHYKQLTLDKNSKSLQDWMTTFQKNNTEKHDEFMKLIGNGKETMDLKLDNMRKDLENKMLTDKQEVSAQFVRFSEKFDLFSNTLTKVSTSNEHIVNMLNKMADRQTEQDKMNIQIYQQISKQQ